MHKLFLQRRYRIREKWQRLLVPVNVSFLPHLGNSQMIAKSYASNANNSQEFGSECDNSCVWRMLLLAGHWYSRIFWSCAQNSYPKKILIMTERSEISNSNSIDNDAPLFFLRFWSIFLKGQEKERNEHSTYCILANWI